MTTQTWTASPPTIEGLYWLMTSTSHVQEINAVPVRIIGLGLDLFAKINHKWISVSSLKNVSWSGPIPIPNPIHPNHP